MDIATLIGITGGFTLIIISIMIGSPLTAFINIPGLIIVIGGTIMSTLVMQKLSVVLGAVKVAKNAFMIKEDDPLAMIDLIIEIARKAKKEGNLALESMSFKNKTLDKSVRMMVDGIPKEEIIHTIEREMLLLVKRHDTGQTVFKFMGSTAPAMGMIGTMIGLVQMLRELDNPAAIGPAMAIALLTTFYGALFAFLVCNPIAGKLKERTDSEKKILMIIRDGIDLMLKGQSVIAIEEKLIVYLEPKLRRDPSNGR